jgi:hypothetical protein
MGVMGTGNFEILCKERPALAELGGFSERYLHADPARILTTLRIFGEQLTRTIDWELRIKRPDTLNFEGLLTSS